jgi:6-phosphofructokinase 1
VFGHKNLTGTASFLASVCGKELKTKTRAIELSTLQRCAAHIASLTDINEAFEVGRYALNAAVSGKSCVAGVLVRKSDMPYICTADVAPVDEIANLEKTIPLGWIDKENWMLREEFLTYARPLILGELTHTYENGLPKHLAKN